MSANPVPHILLTFDIRPVLTLLDMAFIPGLAIARHNRLTGHNPDHAQIIQFGSETDQKIRITREVIIDDFICMAINSFEHTWVHRDLKHITPAEHRAYNECREAWQALYRCLIFKPEHAGMFAHYQRINDSIFLAIPQH